MKRDSVYLQHILDYNKHIEKFLENVTKEEFLKNVENNMRVRTPFCEVLTRCSSFTYKAKTFEFVLRALPFT